MAPFVISGVPVPPPEANDPPVRLEIYDFVKNEKFFSLYIQALAKMQAMRQKDLASHFQIGGIHGMPYTPWNDVGSKQEGNWGGYCTHNTNLFPTWHRPYVVLFEQEMQKHAAQKAEEYVVDKQAWITAASDIRQPFWDWAKNSVPPDEVIRLKQVTITTPDGKRTNVDNPLFSYRFNPVHPSFKPPYDKWPTTLRYPTSTDANAVSDVDRLVRTLAAEQKSLTYRTLYMLLLVHKWPLFSNRAAAEEVSMTNSLEAIHDTVHVRVGGAAPNSETRGDMGATEMAGFDPIFYLHHAQVDRLLALWSALNPGVWVTPGSSGTGDEGGTWTIPANTEVNNETGLTPFWSSDKSFWSSSQIESCVSFGYNYPDFKGIKLTDPASVREHIMSQVQWTYGSSTKNSVWSALTGGPTGTTLKVAGDEIGIWEWVVRVRVQQFALGGSFSVLFFLGSVPEDHGEWVTSDTYVGSYDVFVNSARERCSNCMNNDGLVVEGFVHLEEPIATKLGTFDPDVVEPHLRDHLQWRVQLGDKVVSAEEVPSLEVKVVAAPLTFTPGTIFPVPRSSPTIFHGITAGMPGGGDEDSAA